MHWMELSSPVHRDVSLTSRCASPEAEKVVQAFFVGWLLLYSGPAPLSGAVRLADSLFQRMKQL